jgi:tetratricopeptide (TPR) repeat protein
MENDKRMDQLLADLRIIAEWHESQRKIQKLLLRILVPFLILLIGFAVYQMREDHNEAMARLGAPDSCQKLRNLEDTNQFEQAANMAHRLIKNNPNDACPFYYVGLISLESGDLKEAEKYFIRAYELFPTEFNEKNLKAVRKRMQTEGTHPSPAFHNGKTSR